MMKKLITVLIFFTFLFNGSLLQAKIVKVKGEAEVRIAGITPEEGWIIAKRRARANAVEKACGIKIVSSTVVKEGSLIGEYLAAFSKGFIIKEKIVEQKTDWIKNTIPPIPVYKIVIEAEVAIPENRNLRLFKAELNKYSFIDGEEAQIIITPLNNAYIGIFNITAEDKIVMLYPNPYMPYEMITPGKKYIFPDPDTFVRLKIKTIKNHKKDTEAFFIIGLPGDKKYRNVFDVFKNKKFYQFTEFFKLLFETVDINVITQEFLPYVVFSKARKAHELSH
ncbi:MAG: hypothetical protein DRP29_08825 [Thermodesulfobacteriota bacterium]|nr:MAG: hypothetical protein DRP29_08825 [Thermodesulfobacteriota bacterium]